MQLPAPLNTPYKTLIADIEKGLVKIPRFQRNFVWSREQSAMLIDSLLKGYPIGTFITWKTKEQLRAIRNLGNMSLPPVPDGDFTIYVLDGQQRMTSLFCALKGVKVERDGRTDDFSEIYVNLKATEDEQIATTEIEMLDDGTYIRLTDLTNGSLKVLASFDEELHDKIDQYKNTLLGHNFSIVEVREAPIEVATEIFTRINVGGKPLSVFEVMVAKTYMPASTNTQEFDLADKFDALCAELDNIEYGEISNATALQTISLILTGSCTRQDILRLNKMEFVAIWQDATQAIKAAIDFFRQSLHVPVLRLLPYHALIAPIAYFFYKTKGKPANTAQHKLLTDFFWRVGLSERYSSAVESKLTQDIRRIEQILEDECPEYDFGEGINAQYIQENGFFSTSRSFIKGMLCILSSLQPRSFHTGAAVNIRNDWLIQANSKNYHHFFPKAYIKKIGSDDFYINHIANITIVDDFLNKRLIGAKPPSKYMREFSKNNPAINEHMDTHLVKMEWGVTDNNYDLFFEERCAALAKEVSKRISKKRRRHKISS